MKKLILLIAIIGFFVQSYAQNIPEKDVPAAVTIAFYKVNPSITDVNWIQDGHNYEATYVVNNVARSASYYVSGILIKTQLEIVASALPSPAMDYVKINYKEDHIRKAFKVTDTSNVVTYEAHLKGMNLSFDSEGNFLNSIKY